MQSNETRRVDKPEHIFASYTLSHVKNQIAKCCFLFKPFTSRQPRTLWGSFLACDSGSLATPSGSQGFSLPRLGPLFSWLFTLENLKYAKLHQANLANKNIQKLFSSCVQLTVRILLLQAWIQLTSQAQSPLPARKLQQELSKSHLLACRDFEVSKLIPCNMPAWPLAQGCIHLPASKHGSGRFESQKVECSTLNLSGNLKRHSNALPHFTQLDLVPSPMRIWL